MSGLQRLRTHPIVPRVLKHNFRAGQAVRLPRLNNRAASIVHVFDGPPACATIRFPDGTRGAYLVSELEAV